MFNKDVYGILTILNNFENVQIKNKKKTFSGKKKKRLLLAKSQ